MREDRAGHPIRVPERCEHLDAAKRVVLPVGEPLVVDVVNEGDEPPRFLVLAEHARVPAHSGLDRQQVLPKAFALHVLGDERPGAVA